MEYGVVTPFGLQGDTEVLQLFDRRVLERFFPPFTMMTNLGTLTSAVEFDPAQLVAALQNVRVVDVVRDDSALPPTQHKVGILTGNGPESGMLLWESMNDHIREHGDTRFRGDLAFPHVLIESVPEMGLSMELATRVDQVRPVVLNAVDRLCKGGATIVGIACNTTQFFAPEVADVCARYDARFVSVPDETAAYLHRQGIREFDFFGISATTDFGGWSAFTELNEEFDLVRPDNRELAKITEVAFSVKQRGVDGRAVNRLRNLVTEASQTETVVIALTELSAVLHRHPKNRGGKRIVDTLQLLAEAMAEIVLSERAVVDAPGRQNPADAPRATARAADSAHTRGPEPIRAEGSSRAALDRSRSRSTGTGSRPVTAKPDASDLLESS